MFFKDKDYTFSFVPFLRDDGRRSLGCRLHAAGEGVCLVGMYAKRAWFELYSYLSFVLTLVVLCFEDGRFQDRGKMQQRRGNTTKPGKFDI